MSRFSKPKTTYEISIGHLRKRCRDVPVERLYKGSESQRINFRRCLLDTDHLSILQRQTGNDYRNLSTRMAQCSLSDFAISTVTFHEQMLGCHAYINRARNLNDVVKGYEMMARLVGDFKVLPLVSFDAAAAAIFDTLDLSGKEYRSLIQSGSIPHFRRCLLQIQKIQMAKMDARIAAIALSRGLILLTRNHRDFGKVSGLVVEDWTV